MVSTLGKCNSLIIIDENLESIKKDNFIKILPINWKFFTNEKKDFLIYE
jgi:molybdopterin molybdotransferase